jgi:peptidoglycan-associated lipoprotein
MKITSSCTIGGLAAAFATLALVTACAHEDKPAVAGTAVVTSAPLAPASPATPTSLIFLSETFRETCGIKAIASQKEAPKFDYDRSAVLTEDRDALAQVAQCLTTGPLKGRSVKLVGRADPRGTQEYNMALGARRSSSVMNYLVALGVPSTQMRETSRGALDATGSDQAAWQADRRVDVDILDAAP